MTLKYFTSFRYCDKTGIQNLIGFWPIIFITMHKANKQAAAQCRRILVRKHVLRKMNRFCSYKLRLSTISINQVKVTGCTRRLSTAAQWSTAFDLDRISLGRVVPSSVEDSQGKHHRGRFELLNTDAKLQKLNVHKANSTLSGMCHANSTSRLS